MNGKYCKVCYKRIPGNQRSHPFCQHHAKLWRESGLSIDHFTEYMNDVEAAHEDAMREMFGDDAPYLDEDMGCK